MAPASGRTAPRGSLAKPGSSAPLLAAAAAATVALAGLRSWPGLELACFARGAAVLAGLFSGAPVEPVPEGWALAAVVQPVVVTAACSATDFFMMTAALFAWHGARSWPQLRWLPAVVGTALAAAFVATLAVNALRIVAVAHAHRWVIPHFPPTYEAFLHLFTGVAVFLPALIALHVLLELHASRRLVAIPARPAA